MAVKINAGLVPAGIRQETSFGAITLDFSASGKVRPLLYEIGAAPMVTDDYQKTTTPQQVGWHVQEVKGQSIGLRKVSVEFPSHRIPIETAQNTLQCFLPSGYSFASATHTLNIEAAAAEQQNQTYSIWLPRFDGVLTNGEAEVVRGCIPQKIDIDFVAGTWSYSFAASSVSTVTTDAGVPKWSSDYSAVPAGGIVGAMPAGLGYLAAGANALQTSALTMSIERNITTDERAYSNGVLSAAICDGINITGHYECVTLDADTANNIANAIKNNAGVANYGSQYKACFKPQSGGEWYIGFSAAFKNEKIERKQGGWVFSCDFDVVRDSSQQSGSALLCKFSNNAPDISTLL
jgi:hypothetical protein